MDEFHDSGKQTQHNVYITPDEIVQVHHSLVDNLHQLSATTDDPLKIILGELAAPPALGSAAKGPGSEVILRLSNRFAKINSEDNAVLRKLLKETKRLILLIIRFSTGKTLLDILEQAATVKQETLFTAYILSQDISNIPVPLNPTASSPSPPSPLDGSNNDVSSPLPYQNADDHT